MQPGPQYATVRKVTKIIYENWPLIISGHFLLITTPMVVAIQRSEKSCPRLLKKREMKIFNNG